MSVSVSWYNEEERIIQLQFSQNWNWNDLKIAIQQSHQEMDKTLSQGNLVLDMRQSPEYMIGTVANTRNMLICRGPVRRFHNIVFLGAPRTFRELVNIVINNLEDVHPLANIHFTDDSDNLSQLCDVSIV